jgi:hypothetical protein
MKIFSYLFSLYFLALTIMPCTDVHAMNESASEALAGISNEEHQDCPHEKEEDYCPPFCVCNCCGQLLGATKFQKWFCSPALLDNFKKGRCFFYTQNWHSEYLRSVFHPPQV